MNAASIVINQKILDEKDQLREDCIRLTHERDQAANCIYEVREALSNGDPGAAMEAVINYEFHLEDKE